MRLHVKSRNPILQKHCINDLYATDTWFSTTTSYEGYYCAHIFYDTRSKLISHYGLATESDGPNELIDLSGRKVSHYISTTRENSNMKSSAVWNDYMRNFWVKDRFIET